MDRRKSQQVSGSGRAQDPKAVSTAESRLGAGRPRQAMQQPRRGLARGMEEGTLTHIKCRTQLKYFVERRHAV